MTKRLVFGLCILAVLLLCAPADAAGSLSLKSFKVYGTGKSLRTLQIVVSNSRSRDEYITVKLVIIDSDGKHYDSVADRLPAHHRWVKTVPTRVEGRGTIRYKAYLYDSRDRLVDSASTSTYVR